MEQETGNPLWRKVLTGAGLVCSIAAFIFALMAIGAETPGNTLPFDPRLCYQVLMGLFFVIQGILDWKEHRLRAAFDFGIPALVLVLLALRYLR